MPLIRRMPKRGFQPIRNNYYQVVNIEDLNGIKEKDVVTPEIMKEYGLVSKSGWPIKILGDGELKKPLTVKSHAFSKTAKERIEKAGGKTETIPQQKVK
jgi:large subunit ribosomal protein L15